MHRRRADALGAVRERRDRRRVGAEAAVALLDLTSRRDRGLLLGPRGVRPEVGDACSPDTVADWPGRSLHVAVRAVAPTTPPARPRSARRRSARRARRRAAGSQRVARPSATARDSPSARRRPRTPSTNWRTMPAVANAPSPNARTSARPRAPRITAATHREPADPRRDQQPVAQHLAARGAPRQRGRRPPSGTAARGRSAWPCGRSTAPPPTGGCPRSASARSGNTVPSSTTNASPANSRLLARNADSRDTGGVDATRRAQLVAAPRDRDRCRSRPRRRGT